MKKDYKRDIIILCIFLVICSVFSYIFSRWPDFDFFAYHYYNGWAFLHNRVNIDFFPCLFRSYFNPLLDSLIYISMMIFNNHPIIFILFSGLKYGFFMFFSYKIAELIFKREEKYDIPTILFCTILTAFSPVLLFCNNFDNTDLQVGLLVLIGIYVYLKNVFCTSNKNRMKFVLLAGLLMGLAVGFKYTCFSSPMAIILVSLFMHKRIEDAKSTIFTLIAGMIYGFMITGLPWMVILNYKFQNPLFPYFNNIFMSPMADSDGVLNSDYNHLLPKNIIDFIFYPIKSTLGEHFISIEQKYFDLKNYLGFIFGIYALLIIRSQNIEKKFEKWCNFDIICFSLLFIILTYYINLLVFANYRYILPVFVFVPAIICFVVKYICKKQFYTHVLAIICILSVCTFMRIGEPIKWKEVAPTKIVNIEKIKLEKGSIVICSQYMACFFAPAQNKDIKYIGYSMQPELLERSIWVDSEYKNFNYQNKYLRYELSNILYKNKNVYFAYPLEKFLIGKNKEEIKLYEESLSIYMGKTVKLNNCKSVEYWVMKDNYPNEIKICKIK